MHQPIAVYRHSRTSATIRLSRLVLIVAILSGIAVTLSAQSTADGLSFADSLQRLERQPEHPQFFERLTATALLAESPRLATEIILKHRDRVRDPDKLAELDLLLGRFAQIQSNLARAREYFARAAEADTPARPRALSSLAAVQLEFGELEEALTTAQEATAGLDRLGSLSAEGAEVTAADPAYRSWERSLLTQATALAALERSDEAIELLTAVAVPGTTHQATPALLLLLVELASEQADQELLESTYDTLVEVYPDSPERRLAARYREGGTTEVVGAGLVEYFPRPSRLLSGGSPEVAGHRDPGGEPASRPQTGDTPPRDEPTAEPSSTAANTGSTTSWGNDSATRTVYGVQTGSFRDAENAQYMVRDLQNQSFQARQRRRTVGNNEFHQVYVPVEDGDPQEILVRLKESGFEGFLLFE